MPLITPTDFLAHQVIHRACRQRHRTAQRPILELSSSPSTHGNGHRPIGHIDLITGPHQLHRVNPTVATDKDPTQFGHCQRIGPYRDLHPHPTTEIVAQGP